MTDDLAATQREYNRKVRESAEVLRSLLQHPGWKVYLELIETVGQNYNAQLNEPLENVFMVTKTEYAKGALMGLTLAASLPRSKINEANELPGGKEN